MKYKKIFEPVFRTTVAFFTDCSLEEFSKGVKKLGLPPPEDCIGSEGLTVVFDQEHHPKAVKGVVHIVWVGDKKSVNNLLHETAHLAISVLGSKGIGVNDGDLTEVFAYYQEFWFRTLLEVMSK